ncbi:Prephenate dehydratase-domain-containing protein [Mycena pura]|uniref:prephenate dehydratase n=1 Tax=Mycena pura TaxID=153505 RepID=A0AAD6YJF9_9AGAR|nr:Prephenate dehydratase-domain-containing protein [Mycena pura]
MHEPFVVVFLGPLGTYSHQVNLPASNQLLPVADARVSDAVASRAAHAGVIPQENSIFGSVAETYDALRKPNVGFVQGEVVLKVQHCLLAPRGVKRDDIRCIKSHEQALGQCRGFLAQYFPAASLEKMPSTAAAAKAVLGSCDSAAICSSICTTVFDGLEILYEGIQDQDSNYTRFYILSATRNTTLPPPTYPIPGQTRCLIRLSSVSNDASRPPLIMQLLAALALPVSRLDRRPQLESTQLFQDVYFVEVAREDTDHSERWILGIERAIENVRTVGSEAELLGIW